MPILSKFIDSLHTKYFRSAFREVIHPVQLNGSTDERNILIQVNKGNFFVGKNDVPVKPDSFYFFPQGQKIYVKHGKANKYTDLGKEGFKDDEHRARYLETISGLDDFSGKKEAFTIIGFDVLLYNAMPFFPLIEIPPFPLPADNEFGYLIRHIALEAEQNKLGKEKIISNYMEEIVIHMCRYIASQPKLRNYIDKIGYLTDKRLVDIVRYVQDNLDKDLSNKSISNIAFVSEDYVGQFFKSLTGRNLQDYIENQRLEKAMQLLKSQPDNVQEIAHAVGFKDAAYFSRRFKMKFGANAVAVRNDRRNYVV
ncbi:MAG: AraC family transcriptional regulator [Bacteroidetes bacterium]|nr:AraC family transcriptional regulator [Bacteroidota bacterium]